MSYSVKHIFGPTLQGEGVHAGRPCVFLRFAGCNAWDGRAETKADSACPYCDTDFRGGRSYSVEDILTELQDLAQHTPDCGCVVTGGEPLLQADTALLDALAEQFAWVDIETNGTRPCPPRLENVFISCSPKKIANQPIVIEPDWWKVLIPDQQSFLEEALSSGKPVFVQPVCLETATDDGLQSAAYRQSVKACLDLCYRKGCAMSLQLHKYIGIE